MWEIKREGLPEAFSRSTAARDRHISAHVKTTYGPLLQCIKLPAAGGKTMDAWYQHPFAGLEAARGVPEEYKHMLFQLLEEPWHSYDTSILR
eukprot:2667513-Pyramimonas_sp.AAC.1